MDIVTEKTCTKCGEIKNISEFYKNKKSKDGLNWYCKTCQKEDSRKWRNENPERVLENSMKWYKSNIEKARESVRKWNRINSERVRDIGKKWILDNPEKKRENGRKWSKANPDKVNAKNQKRRARISGNGGSYTAIEWKELCNKYNGKCLCCGKKEKMTVDHVVPVKLGGTNNINNIQPLCLLCNDRKGIKIIDYRKHANT